MYQGKYQEKHSHKVSSRKQRHNRWSKNVVLISAIAVLLVGIVGTSLAYLIANSDEVTNTFNPPNPDIEIIEEFDKETKTNVTVKNTSDYPVYARATYVAYWVSDEGDTAGAVVPGVPELTSSFGSNWTLKENGYWYYNKVLAVGETSDNFINSMTADKVEGRHLVIDVIAETVQAVGVGDDGLTPVEDVWGVSASSFITR